jgi:hypothetical protein
MFESETSDKVRLFSESAPGQYLEKIQEPRIEPRQLGQEALVSRLFLRLALGRLTRIVSTLQCHIALSVQEIVRQNRSCA